MPEMSRQTHLDVQRGGLHLEASWTRNRKSGFQQLPIALLERLEAFVRSGEAEQLYDRFYGIEATEIAYPRTPYSTSLPIQRVTLQSIWKPLASRRTHRVAIKQTFDR